MDELINMVAQKAGIGPDKARTAVETVLGFAKSKLPAPLAGQLESALAGRGGGGAAGGSAGSEDVSKGLGGIFGSK